ncbi:hypothetical protein B296_00021940 [Ensete ventricosum]|uniref:Uncharacterized protein n=1 Tax=Ensete ventricosum TaxID=4639 RepID=A0A426YIC8_ENSVE|nr:hypothetical protein B296_00021940 [Ensete ventricosum]
MSAPATSLRHERRDPSFEASPLEVVEVGPLTSKAYYVARFACSHVFGQPGYGSVRAHPRVHLQRGRDTTDGTRRLSTFEVDVGPKTSNAYYVAGSLARSAQPPET